MKKNISAIVFVVLAIIVGLYIYKKYRIAPLIGVYNQNLIDSTGKVVNLRGYKDKKLIVTFYASWCGNCIREMNSLQKVKNELPKDWQIVAITDEGYETMEEFRMQKSFPWSFYSLTQPFGNYKIYSIPVTYIFNEKAELVYEQVGEIDWTDLSFREHIEALLNK